MEAEGSQKWLGGTRRKGKGEDCEQKMGRDYSGDYTAGKSTPNVGEENNWERTETSYCGRETAD